MKERKPTPDQGEEALAAFTEQYRAEAGAIHRAIMAVEPADVQYAYDAFRLYDERGGQAGRDRDTAARLAGGAEPPAPFDAAWYRKRSAPGQAVPFAYHYVQAPYPEGSKQPLFHGLCGQIVTSSEEYLEPYREGTYPPNGFCQKCVMIAPRAALVLERTEDATPAGLPNRVGRATGPAPAPD